MAVLRAELAQHAPLLRISGPQERTYIKHKLLQGVRRSRLL